MNNYYELLGVSQGATPSVVKIAYEGKLKALARSGLAEAQRKAEERELEKACVTLSSPSKRTWYDNQLEKQHATESASQGSRGLIAGAVVVALLAAGIGWYFVDRGRTREGLRIEAERLKLEQERLVFERDKAQRVLELEKASLEQPAAPRQVEIRVLGDDRDQALRERAYSDAQARADRDAAFREEVRKRALDNHDRLQQQRQEDRDRRQSEEERRRAIAEVERLKQGLRQRELEEERARTERYNRARSEDLARQRREAAESRKR